MDYEKNICPVIKVDGVASSGKQYDFNITIPDDSRGVIYGIVKDSCHEPVKDAVVKLIEVESSCGCESRKPVSHTFTDEHGQFVFGPLCSNRLYELEIWVNRVQHCKITTNCDFDGDCLKGIDMSCKQIKTSSEKNSDTSM